MDSRGERERGISLLTMSSHSRQVAEPVLSCSMACPYHQGQLYCAAQARCRACSLRAAGGKGYQLSCSHDPRARSAICSRCQGARMGEGISSSSIPLQKRQEAGPALPCPYPQGWLTCNSHRLSLLCFLRDTQGPTLLGTAAD